MTIDRRGFLIGSLAGVGAIACSEGPAASPKKGPTMPAAKPAPKTILILGGTGFLGPHIVEAARARGHTVTLFNRGKTHPTLFPDVEKLQGDRDGKLDSLAGRKWDAVVDTSGYVPRIVKQSAELLAPSVGHYLFISTISVYAKSDKVGADETSPLATLDEPASEDVAKHYGALKAGCETACEAALPGRVATIRPGWIVGPLDPTGRFTHWPVRLAEGGEVLAPGDGTTPIQLIDGRDLAAWIVTLIENRTTGVFNAFGPSNHPKINLSIKQLLDDCNTAAGNKASLTWVSTEFLDNHEVSPWAEMPGWVPAEGDYAGFGRLSNQRAVDAGLTFRPIADTAQDTLAWLALPDVEAWVRGTAPFGSAAMLSRDEPAKRRAIRGSGITREKEAKVLAAWKARG
ncbi:MAG: NAD-dependent epimerase/dehydratase family protein [Deltaproteobacteria bacterium]|nr:NAD-dependent epimerase/dehydratase family protein [Deltaproteobacteria bacterium]